MKSYLIKNAQIINEGTIKNGDVLIQNGRIEQVAGQIDTAADIEIDASGKYLIPGVIDDQVHFREPGLTHKAEIYTEARAAVAGGTTSFMEMPNTKPSALTQDLLEDKYIIAKNRSLANYSFFMGVSNDNAEEVLKTDPKNVCGIKIFMGSSTGNMLVDSESTLSKIFKEAPCIIALHCEDEATITENTEYYKRQFGDNIPVAYHPIIRDVEACYKSSAFAKELALEYNTRIHILHISTAKEAQLFRNDIPLEQKKITSEACVHHLWFTDEDYAALGSQVKCNPAIKEQSNRKGIWEALLSDKIDVIATDHAPHTWEEKQNGYFQCPSGVPLVQHALYMMLEHHKQGRISLEKLVEKMCHAPATLFQIAERGYIREGYWADLVLFDLNDNHTVSKEILEYKCGWSPFEGHTFPSNITHTFVSGHLAYANGQFDESKRGERLIFDRL